MKKVPQVAVFGESNRGRPRHMSNLFEDPLKSIIPIALKYNLNPKLLVEAFIEAWKNKTATCGDLIVHCRIINQDSAIFLVTKENDVVSQLSIKLRALNDPVSFKNSIKNIPVFDISKKETEQKQKKISDLRSGMKKIDIKAKVAEVPPMKAVVTRFGTQSFVSNIVITDETGSIKLSLWDDQIDKVHVGDIVEINNGYVASFAGEPQLRLGRKGTISVNEQ